MDKRYSNNDIKYVKCSLPNCQMKAVVREVTNEKNFDKCSIHLKTQLATASTRSFRQEVQDLRKEHNNVRGITKHRV